MFFSFAKLHIFTIIGTMQLRASTPTENARPPKVTGIGHSARNHVFLKLIF
jgi:hypothetical protein